MRKEVTVMEPCSRVEITCDRCHGQADAEHPVKYKSQYNANIDDYYRKRIYTCFICGRDVCLCCSSEYDYDYLDPGHYSGDYPEHVCDECWKVGEPFIKEITTDRTVLYEKEKKLMAEWKSAAK